MNGFNGMCLTQKVIDAYRMQDGKTIDEALKIKEKDCFFIYI